MITAQIIPSILVYSAEEFDSQILTIKDVCQFVQIDIADGVFVEGKTWIDPAHVAKNMPIDFELHMMVQNPVEEIQRWKDIPELKHIIFHYEAVEDISAAVQNMKAFGRKVIVCLNPDTPIEVIDSVTNDIDGVQFMSVYPGKQGQPFVENTVERIATLHAKYPSLPISDDGAVNATTIPPLFAAGARRFGPGSAVWKGDAVKNYLSLVELIQELE